MKDEISFTRVALHPSSLLLHPLFSRVWCNASIRVLETRGDSSILSSRTRKISNGRSQISEFAPVAQLEESDASNVVAVGSNPARSPNYLRE